MYMKMRVPIVGVSGRVLRVRRALRPRAGAAPGRGGAGRPDPRRRDPDPAIRLRSGARGRLQLLVSAPTATPQP